VLATRIPWERIESVLTPRFEHKDRAGQVVQGQDLLGATVALVGAGRSNAGQPKTPIRLMASLLYLKQRTVQRQRKILGIVMRRLAEVEICRADYLAGAAG